MRKIFFISIFFILQAQLAYSAAYFIRPWWGIYTKNVDGRTKSYLNFEIGDSDDHNRPPTKVVVTRILLALPGGSQLDLPIDPLVRIYSRIDQDDNNGNGQIDIDIDPDKSELSSSCIISFEYEPEILPSPHPPGDYTLGLTFTDQTTLEVTKTFNGGLDANSFPSPSNMALNMDSQTGEILIAWENPEPNLWDGEIQIRITGYMETGALYHCLWRYRKLSVDTESWTLSNRFADFMNLWHQTKFHIQVRAYSADGETWSHNASKYYELDGYQLIEIDGIQENINGSWSVSRGVTIDDEGSLTIGP